MPRMGGCSLKKADYLGYSILGPLLGVLLLQSRVFPLGCRNGKEHKGKVLGFREPRLSSPHSFMHLFSLEYPYYKVYRTKQRTFPHSCNNSYLVLRML